MDEISKKSLEMMRRASNEGHKRAYLKICKENDLDLLKAEKQSSLYVMSWFWGLIKFYYDSE